ncbi:hypothetical protein [Saccharopolyspora spinosa]|uniref:Uncharacterized protein n=1 Tax=Saccharopolyspora spinosa TaxID=60894 RepID=A0A2N3XZU5_SACSN|nr:hypothetical protein [Saccharopolyspora spinosa]PKW16196.1 hypothetical protein A8926_4006 [Saccharopolyspora spinosa]
MLWLLACVIQDGLRARRHERRLFSLGQAVSGGLMHLAALARLHAVRGFVVGIACGSSGCSLGHH